MPHLPGPLCPLVRHVRFASRTSYLTCSTVNHYEMQPILMECYHNGLMWFISYISLQDILIYVKLTIVIHQPKCIRKPALRRASQMELKYFYFHNFNTLYPLKNKKIKDNNKELTQSINKIWSWGHVEVQKNYNRPCMAKNVTKVSYTYLEPSQHPWWSFFAKIVNGFYKRAP